MSVTGTINKLTEENKRLASLVIILKEILNENDINIDDAVASIMWSRRKENSKD
jgi:hypothetical protein